MVDGYEFCYRLDLQNSAKDNEGNAVVKNNVKVKIVPNDLLEVTKISYYVEKKDASGNIVTDEDGDAMLEEKIINSSEITLDSLSNKRDIKVYVKLRDSVQNAGNAEFYATATCDGNVARSNKITRNVKTINLTASIEANNSGEVVTEGQEIDYTITVKNEEDSVNLNNITIEDTIFSMMDINEITVDGIEADYMVDAKEETVEEDGETVYQKNPMLNVLSINTDLPVGATKTILIKSTVSAGAARKIDERTEITNDAKIIIDNKDPIECGKVIHTLEAMEKSKEEYSKDDYGDENPNTPSNPSNPSNPTNPEDPANPDNPTNPNTPANPDEENKTYTISGMAWFDENENGVKDGTEQRLSGITAKLMNLDNNETKTTVTSENGFYSFTGLTNGKYVVIFEYDTEKYMLTSYQADGVSSSKNSDAESVTMKIDGVDKKVSSTDTLTINNNSITDIDIGLALAKTFDLELSKTISKVTVTNGEGTKTTNYDNTTYAKAEIHAKYVEGSTVIVEYKIKVSNTGELAGYAKSIVDYKPADLTFDSSLNAGWYQSGNNLYSNSLANTKLEPGESKELTLVLTKRVTETNMGLVNNLAEIEKDYTALGIADKDSTPGNKGRGEDDLGSADLSIGVKTGAAISYVTFTISVIGILIAGAYLVSWNLLKKKEI